LTLLAAALTLALALYRGAPALDQALSMRPAVNRMRVLQAGQGESADLPVAVLRLSREAEYGLQFYTDQTIARYEQGEVPRGEHILIAPRALAIGVRRRTEGRRILLLGSFDPQGWDLYRVSRVEGP
jgi:hypothetical protein